MKHTLAWHRTGVGRVVLWLGSLQLAVPVLVLVAIALGVGTFLESTRGVELARQYVYGSWWFLASMGLMCVSLLFAVITRYPWKRKHIGFITVHASLITLIVAGIWSMKTRVEGRLVLEEGASSDMIELTEERLEVVRHDAGNFVSLAETAAPAGPGSVMLDGVRVQVVERWANSRDEETVLDDCPRPLRAVDIAPVAGPQSAWVGQEDQAGPAPTLLGLKVLVLPEGSEWQPPKPGESSASVSFAFVLDGRRIPLTEVGQEALPGWRVVDLKRFARAIVTGEGIAEGPVGAQENPAVQVRVSDGKGSTEQHTAFANFPDMVMGKQVEGAVSSNAKLVPDARQGESELLVVFGTLAETKLGYVGKDGVGQVIVPKSEYPMRVTLGEREVVIHQQLARAHAISRTVKMPSATNNRPALLVRIGDDTALQTIAWRGMSPMPSEGGNKMLRFGPRKVRLPFTVRLTEFRKRDYPGTDMAMAYESDVAITLPSGVDEPFSIYMNNPYVHGPWKVYQSGFMGDTLSIFSVMHDPGLAFTYAASVVLCLGVLVTFYSRSLSWGHPGIPIRPVEVEIKDASPRNVLPLVPDPIEQPAGVASN